MAKGSEAPKRGVGRPPRRADAGTHRKVTEQIRYKQAFNWSCAVDYARSVLGRPMTVQVTVQWKFAPSAMPEPERVSDLLNGLTQWIRRRTHHRAVWAYSREGGLKKGVHLHLLFHVPPQLIEDFTVAVERWIEAKSESFSRKPGARAVKVDPIYLPTLYRVKSYLLKEGDDRVHETCEVLAEHRVRRNSYPVPGKRLGVSHSINATARSRHAMPLNSAQDAQEPH